MRFLFVHQNFPGQYRHLAAHYAAQPGNEVVGVGDKRNCLQHIPGVRLLGYQFDEPKSGSFETPVLRALARGKAVAAGLAHLRRGGFRPDLIFTHLGWGEGLFIKDIFPEARILLYCEFFYRARGADMGFDPEFPVTAEKMLRLRVMNAPLLMSLDASDWGMAPTLWQRRQLPREYQARTSVIHDGIDTLVAVPGARAEEELITYVARNLEPYRGFHVFMRAIPEIQRRRPKARIVIVGDDEVSYSPRLPPGRTYRERMLRELEGKIDLSRVHFLGKIPYSDYLALLRKSSAHVYLTYPFVLSWSLLEALSCGCVVVASRTPPVEEVITDGKNGFLVDFFSTEAIAAGVDEGVSARHEAMREAARRTAVERYDLKSVCLPAQHRLAQALLQRQRADARPAADVKHLPRHESRVPVGEEQDRTRNVVGLA